MVLDFFFNQSNDVQTTVPTSKFDEQKEIEEEFSLKSPINDTMVSKIPSEAEFKRKWIKEKVERLSKNFKISEFARLAYIKPLESPQYSIHIFYYPWYRNVEYDGEWKHWNHEYISNWKKDDVGVYPTGRHYPPNDIGSNFYPSLGCYSSRDPQVIETHMKQIRDAGIGKLK